MPLGVLHALRITFSFQTRQLELFASFRISSSSVAATREPPSSATWLKEVNWKACDVLAPSVVEALRVGYFFLIDAHSDSLPSLQSSICRLAAFSQNSATGTPTRVARVRAEYPNQLEYSGSRQAVSTAANAMQVLRKAIRIRLRCVGKKYGFSGCSLRHCGQEHQWSSGRIHRRHRCDPGSIPG